MDETSGLAGYRNDFPGLLFDTPATHVLRVTINNPGRLNALDHALHRQVERIWQAIDSDPAVRCSIITGAGRAFCAGGATDAMGAETDTLAGDWMARDFGSALGLVDALIDAKKPIVSAINGVAVGAGLAIALLADVPIAAAEAKLFDGHPRVGVVAGDHAALIWPLLCGIAKSKYFLLTNEPMTGEQAERNNLVALAVPSEQLAAKAVEVAARIAAGAPTAIRMTKYVLNHWLRQQRPIFDLSAALEMICYGNGEAAEAIRALAEKRAGHFPREPFF
ncbi:MAG: enoyl-CoA hydratase [Alphaproteobacteria bacterium]|nr:enoyl-CoA hydratase [Alphaproteobacteria bacterium]